MALERKRFAKILAISIFTHLFTNITGANILFFHTACTASHRTSIWPLATKLADSGHNVTYMFPIPKRPGYHPKIEELKPSKLYEVVSHHVGDFDVNFKFNNTVNEWLQDFFDLTADLCGAFYDSVETQEWLARPNLHYDLILLDVTMCVCADPLIHKFQAKFIPFHPVTIPHFMDVFGFVPESASVPEFLMHQKPADLQNSLWSRTLNTLAPPLFGKLYADSKKKVEKMLRKKLNFTEGMPSFDEIDQNASLVLHNSYFIEDYSLSLPSFYVSYSGLQCTEKSLKELKGLPEEIEMFVNDTTSEGFVYISFGSSVVISNMPNETRDQFFDAFTSLPEFQFLMRWTGTKPLNTPKNVLLLPWYPQQEVLAHPKIKAFVTQGGRPSTQEALCHAVPMIVMPIFADQDMNGDRVEFTGNGVTLDILSLKSDNFAKVIQEIVYNKKYKETANQLSKMFRDRPMDTVDYVHYWIEFVLNYDTSLLKPLAMKQSWWQRRLIDVYAFLLSVTMVLLASITFIICKVAKLLMKLCGINKMESKLKIT